MILSYEVPNLSVIYILHIYMGIPNLQLFKISIVSYNYFLEDEEGKKIGVLSGKEGCSLYNPKQIEGSI